MYTSLCIKRNTGYPACSQEIEHLFLYQSYSLREISFVIRVQALICARYS